MAKRKDAARKEKAAAESVKVVENEEQSVEPASVSEPEEEQSILDSMFKAGLRVIAVALAVYQAYTIRLFAIQDYGLVIHEFDPWFNFRATKYLAEHGYDKFFTWFDYESWYPLGRPVGSTIYPGMQIVSVTIFNTLESLGMPMSLNDVCCYVPVWGGCCATIFLGLLTYECTANATYATAAAAIMSIIPAHIMRSVGGGYDNESVAMTAMMMTFYFWCRSLRTENSWIFGVLTGAAYVFMVATWGGYVFVLNMVGMHAAVLAITNAVLNRPNAKLHRAFSLFFIIGTYGATRIPVVGMAPLKSFEQLPTFFVFLAIQLLQVCEIIGNSKKMDREAANQLRIKVFGAAAAAGILMILIIMPTGYFGPISSRVRGLFVKHTKTGNPLVDSVAEHQPASPKAYYQNLHFIYYLAPIGFGILCKSLARDSKIFLVLYALVAYYFSSKMSRLIILLGPIASALGGVAIVWLFNYSKKEISDGVADFLPADDEGKKKDKKNPKSTKKKKSKDQTLSEQWEEIYNQPRTRSMRFFGSIMFMAYMLYILPSFYVYCQHMGQAMSHPSLMFKAHLNDGTEVMVDDYREAYWWLRDKTPKDSRVMAWWDYGYQITGIAERTSIADGNTWNHEHIATLGRCLISPEKKAHKMIRHLADYVLVWTGGGGDDLAKSTHIARIANSVYSDMCGDKDILCHRFGFTEHGPTPMMANSLIYKLHSHALEDGVKVNPKYFKHVFSSKFGKVRIYKVVNVSQKSKEWVADPANRKCDAPGSWYCEGNYPPDFRYVLKKRKDFKQLEDFNVADDEDAAAYRKEYMENIRG